MVRIKMAVSHEIFELLDTTHHVDDLDVLLVCPLRHEQLLRDEVRLVHRQPLKQLIN